ncbi:MAG: solute carrier family 23 protein [Burkholderiaceae bacterium]
MPSSRWLAGGATVPHMPKGMNIVGSVPNPQYAQLPHIAISAVVLASILLIAKFAKGFFTNISVLLGIVIGGVIAASAGLMSFEKVRAGWFDLEAALRDRRARLRPCSHPHHEPGEIVVMIVVHWNVPRPGEMTGKPVDQPMLTRGLRTDGLGTLIGGLFNTFPYTSFSQNVGLVGVTGVKSRYVCVAGGLILIVLGLLPKMAALVESLPTFVLGGAGLVMFGMVAATGIRDPGVDFKATETTSSSWRCRSASA